MEKKKILVRYFWGTDLKIIEIMAYKATEHLYIHKQIDHETLTTHDEEDDNIPWAITSEPNRTIIFYVGRTKEQMVRLAKMIEADFDFSQKECFTDDQKLWLIRYTYRFKYCEIMKRIFRLSKDYENGKIDDDKYNQKLKRLESWAKHFVVEGIE